MLEFTQVKSEVLPAINIAGIPVKPFKSINNVVDSIFDDNNVLPGVAIAINPEKILKSLESQEVKNVLLEATIPYADGIGVVKAMEKKTGSKLARIPGVQLWLAIVNKAAKTDNTVFLLGSKNAVINRCANKLKEDTQVNIVGIQDGYYQNEEELIARIVKSNAGVVIAALGSPKQELFIKKCQRQHPNAFYMGVGGSFDVYVGDVKRAPGFWIKLNLEWLYRLLSEPKRILRQYKLLKFVYLHLLGKL